MGRRLGLWNIELSRKIDRTQMFNFVDTPWRRNGHEAMGQKTKVFKQLLLGLL